MIDCFYDAISLYVVIFNFLIIQLPTFMFRAKDNGLISTVPLTQVSLLTYRFRILQICCSKVLKDVFNSSLKNTVQILIGLPFCCNFSSWSVLLFLILLSARLCNTQVKIHHINLFICNYNFGCYGPMVFYLVTLVDQLRKKCFTLQLGKLLNMRTVSNHKFNQNIYVNRFIQYLLLCHFLVVKIQ